MNITICLRLDRAKAGMEMGMGWTRSLVLRVVREVPGNGGRLPSDGGGYEAAVGDLTSLQNMKVYSAQTETIGGLVACTVPK